MAAIDYNGILDALKDLLEADSRMEGIKIFVEDDPVLGRADDDKTVVLMLGDRRPSAGQSMAAGKRTRYMLRIPMWSVGFDMENFRNAAKKRDEILGKLELVVMDNRTISANVTASQLAGGQFLNAKSDDGIAFCSAAETILEAEVSAIN